MRLKDFDIRRGMDLASRMTKENYMEKYRATILDWMAKKAAEILDILDKKEYSVNRESFEDSIGKRNRLETMIKESRQRNEGGVNLATLDEITKWGFGQRFPCRDQIKVLEVTKEVFENVDRENYYEAILRMMVGIDGVGVSRASKIIGLSDQNKLCIYDSRVGHALRELRKGRNKLVKCPPDRGLKRDRDNVTKKDWAVNYERLIWTMEILREYFKAKNRSLRAADIEIALYVIGK